MSMISPRLQLKVAQKQILTPGLVQMVTVLQLNRMELKEMINQEIVNNPVLEESSEASEEITPEELQPLLEADRISDHADKTGRDNVSIDSPSLEGGTDVAPLSADLLGDGALASESPVADNPDAPAADPFDEIDYGSFFDEYLDPGYKSPASEVVEKPSFETFLSQPVTLPDHFVLNSA